MRAVEGRTLEVVYGANVEKVVRILARKGAIEFRTEEPTTEEAVTSDKIIVAPRYAYLPASLIKKVAWDNGISHKRIKRELSNNGKIEYVAITDPKLGEVNRAYIVESGLVLMSICDIVGVPDWFNQACEEPVRVGVIARMFMMSIGGAGAIGV